MAGELMSVPEDPARRTRVRRSALVFMLIAAAFYIGFIVMTLVRASR
jgi:hypothetical protein